MERHKKHFCRLFLYCVFRKTAAQAHRFISKTYSEFALSVKICETKSGDFDLKDKEHSGQSKKFKDVELYCWMKTQLEHLKT